MKTIDINEISLSLKEVLELARHENVVLKADGGQEFLVTELDDFDREVELTRQNKELMSLLDERSKATHRISHEQVKRELGIS
jgi:hypothetical protein